MAKKQVVDLSESEPEEINQTEKTLERVFTSTTEAYSDLFKLEVGKVWKNHGVHAAGKTPDTDPEDWKEWEHCHQYRTRDSDGKGLKTSSSIAGHFHIIETKENPKGGAPIVISCSGPMVMGKTKKAGRWIQAPIPINDYDDHTHPVTYLQTHRIQARIMNVEAQKVIALNALKGANPGGVREG